MSARHDLLFLLWVIQLSCFFNFTAADCECGYSSTIGSSTFDYVFTDLLESDFLHITNISLDTDWQPQSYNVTAEASRGAYGTGFLVTNVVSKPIANVGSFSGPGSLGGDPGLQFLVDGGIPKSDYVGCAEMDSARTDMLWGTYRAAMKLTPVPGTVSAFFWYFNDSMEIDMEFLSEQWVFENNTFPVNLVLQSTASVAAGYNAAGTGNYIVTNLPFNPTDGYHEYRIDFIPGNVIFYGDGAVLAHMNTSAVPTMAGHLILTQWSNGNPLWSYGPPATAAIMTVSYVKAYFNSSLLERQTAWEMRCKDGNALNAICPIPDQTTAPSVLKTTDNTTALPYFFSNDDNKTANQTVYHSLGLAAVKSGETWFAQTLVFTIFLLILLLLL
ncbi:glycoside hydrolase family 16 protein [Coleophoma crateriformis]|uniref:Glycoside hydrolase family 16 protein n=1 Tax=Coleophoma crateriformis TaxID=565419 RepID=A0A3D8T8B0_9HELO|nr:glycoside hydrolase family 16 protein [Coleophoma crateriformis]